MLPFFKMTWAVLMSVDEAHPENTYPSTQVTKGYSYYSLRGSLCKHQLQKHPTEKDAFVHVFLKAALLFDDCVF